MSVDDAASCIAANRQQPPGTKSACQFNGAPIVPRHALAGNKVGDGPVHQISPGSATAATASATSTARPSTRSGHTATSPAWRPSRETAAEAASSPLNARAQPTAAEGKSKKMRAEAESLRATRPPKRDTTEISVVPALLPIGRPRTESSVATLAADREHWRGAGEEQLGLPQHRPRTHHPRDVRLAGQRNEASARDAACQISPVADSDRRVELAMQHERRCAHCRGFVGHIKQKRQPEQLRRVSEGDAVARCRARNAAVPTALAPRRNTSVSARIPTPHTDSTIWTSASCARASAIVEPRAYVPYKTSCVTESGRSAAIPTAAGPPQEMPNNA